MMPRAEVERRAAAAGLNPHTVMTRLYREWPEARAFSEPARPRSTFPFPMARPEPSCPGTGSRVGDCGAPVTRSRYCEPCADWLFAPVLR